MIHATRIGEFSERTRDGAEAILVGHQLTTDDMIARGWCGSRQEAAWLGGQILHMLRKEHADRGFAYVPGEDGNLGHYQQVSKLDEAVRSTRRRLKLTRGYQRSAMKEVQSVPLGLAVEDRPGYAESVRPLGSELMLLGLQVNVDILGFLDPAARVEWLREVSKQYQLERGRGNS